MSIRRRISLWVVSIVAVAVCAVAVQASVLPYGFKVEKVLDNSVALGAVQESPNGEMWLLERTTGLIRVYVAGKPSATLTLPVYATGESGLLGVAFAPDYAASGRAFVSSVDASRTLRVDEIDRTPGGLAQGVPFLLLGTVPSDGRRPGGGIDVGPDGKLYVAVGDLELPGSAQDDGQMMGKILRANLDGTVPSDNPSGTLVWAKGFRSGKGLDINATTARANGTVYLTDVGTSSSPAASDEVNQVLPGGNYAWNVCSGMGCGASYVDPLCAYAAGSLVDPESVAANASDALGASHRDALVYTAVTSDRVREARLTGPERDQLVSDAVFFNPSAITDGNTAPVCPHQSNEVASGRDGWLYLANQGTNPGIWRIWRDTPGPREVSAPGSPFPLTVGKSGSNLLLGWENLGPLDAGRPTRNAGQQSEAYSVWEGSLPITAYDHARILNTNGTADGPARLTATVTPGSGSHYYLVGAQGDNMDGSLGRESDGAARPGPVDYCATIGYGINAGQCAREFVSPVNGTTLKLVDYNPDSPTYLQAVSISDYRGRVVKLDLAANDCFWCQVQAQLETANDTKYRDRDFLFVSVFTRYLSTLQAYPDAASCAAAIATWVATYHQTTPILCDVDLNADGRGDVTWEYWHQADCGGVPQNFYIDQGNTIYSFVCGAQGAADVENGIKNEVNPMSCE